MNKIFETPLWVSADTENRCFEIYDNNNDRVASDIEELEQAKLFAAAPEMYWFIEHLTNVTGHALLSEAGYLGENLYNEAKELCRKARGESEVCG